MSEPDLQPVDRTRRFKFVSMVVGACIASIILMAGMAAMGTMSPQFIPLVNTAMNAMSGLAMAVSLTFLGSETVDYNGKLIAERMTRNAKRTDVAEKSKTS